MIRLRPFIAGLLALVLVLTSQGYAMARHAPDATGAMVICTGTGPVTVLIDENGQPTGRVHICPDCIAGLYDVTGALPPSGPHDHLARSAPQAAAPVTSIKASLPLRFHARAPPPGV